MVLLPVCCIMFQFYSLPQWSSFSSKPDVISSTASLFHVIFCCQTNLYFISSLAHGSNCPHTRLQLHSPQQTLCSLVSSRHPVSCLISPIFRFLPVDPISPSTQSYCHCIYSFTQSYSSLTLLPCISSYIAWGRA